MFKIKAGELVEKLNGLEYAMEKINALQQGDIEKLTFNDVEMIRIFLEEYSDMLSNIEVEI